MSKTDSSQPTTLVSPNRHEVGTDKPSKALGNLDSPHLYNPRSESFQQEFYLEISNHEWDDWRWQIRSIEISGGITANGPGVPPIKVHGKVDMLHINDGISANSDGFDRV